MKINFFLNIIYNCVLQTETKTVIKKVKNFTCIFLNLWAIFFFHLGFENSNMIEQFHNIVVLLPFTRESRHDSGKSNGPGNTC